MSKEQLKIAVSAGELSGDQHMASLIKSLRKENPNVDVRGMGGSALKSEGVSIILNSEIYGSLNGFNIPKILILGIFSYIRMIIFLYKWRPQKLILVDYPDFNLKLAKVAKLLKIETIYFIPPKVWAWRQKRVELFKKYIDKTLVIFPFEKEFFESKGYHNVEFVGHPFSTELETDPGLHFKNRDAFLRSLGLVPTFPTVSVFLGSRKSEVKRHLNIALNALIELKKEVPDAQAVIPIAKSIKSKSIKRRFSKYDWIVVTERDSKEVMKNTDAGMLKSGTCNLEACFLGLPFLCFYNTSNLSAWLVRKYVQIKEYSLVNILKSKTAKEFIQEDTNPKEMAAEAKKLIYDREYRSEFISNLNEIKTILSTDSKSAYEKAASEVNLAKKAIVKEKKPEKLISRLFVYLKPYKKVFALAMGCMVCFGATDGALPFIVKYFLDGVFSSQDTTMLYLLPVLLMALALFRAANGFGQEYLMAKIGHSIVKDIRNNLHAHILKFNPGYFHKNSSGDILARFTSDVILVKDFLTQSSSAVIRDSIRIIALVSAAIYLDPKLAFIALFALPIGVFPIYYFGKRIRKLSKRGQNEIGSISGLIQETVAGNRVIKLFNQEKSEQKKFESSNHELTKTFIKSEKVKAYSNPVNELLAVIAICGVILYGGFTVIEGTRTQGDFIAFLLSVFLLYDPFKKLSKVYHQMQQGASGAERIFEVLDEESPILESKNPIDFPKNSEISFNNVSFSYKEDSNEVLSEINLRIQPEQKVAIVGLSGAGKSTLVDLIPRFIDPTQGSVSIGNIDIKDIKVSELRENVSMVNQHTFLFNDTIFNNIAYGKKDPSIEEIENAAKTAYAHDFIMQLPNQYQTNVGESGFSLSGGERQRIAIARAVLKNAPILILDEATASLDNQSENEVQKALEKLESGRTSIIIAHRLSTIRSADVIVVMSDGKIVEHGTHDNLLTSQGMYSKLHSLQFREPTIQ